MSKLSSPMELKKLLNERVREYWNKLPNDIKVAPSINSFRNRLESYKLDCISSANERPGNFWELPDVVLSRIEGAKYAYNKSSHNEFLKRNPYVAKRNLSTCTERLHFDSFYIVFLYWSLLERFC